MADKKTEEEDGKAGGPVQVEGASKSPDKPRGLTAKIAVLAYAAFDNAFYLYGNSATPACSGFSTSSGSSLKKSSPDNFST